MTIRAMQRAVLLVLAALAAASFAACGSSNDPEPSQGSEEALRLAEDATEDIAALEERADDLAEELDKVDSDRRALASKFERIHKDLRDSIATVRASLSGISDEADSARDSAQAALGEMEDALERLSVLENRFDYHLRNDH